MAQITYSVPGISCDHCKHAIETEVASIPGVSIVTVDVDAKMVSIEGDAADARLRAAITEAGFEVAGAPG